MKRFVGSVDRRQVTLLPSCLDDNVTEVNLARMVKVFVDELDPVAECGAPVRLIALLLTENSATVDMSTTSFCRSPRGHANWWAIKATAPPSAEPKRGIGLCIPCMRLRKQPSSRRRGLHRQRYHIENILGRMKNRPCIAARHDRRANIFVPAICIAAAVTLRL